MNAPDTPWWQSAVIYQVYPRSFQDTGGDGIGDLAGITARVEYLAGLGVDAVWVSPFYPSPMADFGYDVADYCGVDPIFGTLEDFDRLIAAVHSAGMKLILDFVPNHSSDRHPWFLESRRSQKSAKRDWYIWRDGGPEGGPPNNWLSHFGGPAWTWDAATGQYYLHSFLAAQPDLNWRNPEVKAAIFAAMRFWLDKGVDGFRMDVLWLLVKDAWFRDNPVNPEWRPGAPEFGRYLPVYTADRPETHTIVAEMRALLDGYAHTPYTERLLIGEIYLPIRELVLYYGSSAPEGAGADGPGMSAGVTAAGLDGAQLPFNFHLIETPWQAPAIARLIREYEAALPEGAWPNWVLGNHDQSRLATRIGPAQARVAAMLLLTLRGTPTLYYGDELGMTDGVIAPDEVRDPAEKNQPGIGMGRDPERTPMIWENVAGAGFTTGTPWLPIAPDFVQRSVETEQADPGSMLQLYRTLLKLRRELPALHSGAISDVQPEDGSDGDVLRYRRAWRDPGGKDQRLQILLNLGVHREQASCAPGQVLHSTALQRGAEEVADHATLEAGEGLIVVLD